MAEPIESGIGGVWYAKQTTKGTAPAAALTRPRVVEGTELKANKKNGETSYVDGQKYSSPTTFTDSVGGEVGTVKLQVQPENGGLFAAQALGSDTVTGASVPYTHTITSAGTTQPWGTWWQRMGQAVGPARQQFIDSKINKWTVEAGADKKVLEYSLGLMALIAGRTYATDPAKAEDTSDPFLFTESTGAIVFDGVTLTGVNGEIIDVDQGIDPFMGNSIAPTHLVDKRGKIERTINTIVDSDTLPLINKAIYGATAPAAGTDPVKAVYHVAATSTYVRDANSEIKFTTPRIAIDAENISLAPKDGGGVAELVFGGTCKKGLAAEPALTITAKTADAAAYV